MIRCSGKQERDTPTATMTNWSVRGEQLTIIARDHGPLETARTRTVRQRSPVYILPFRMISESMVSCLQKRSLQHSWQRRWLSLQRLTGSSQMYRHGENRFSQQSEK